MVLIVCAMKSEVTLLANKLKLVQEEPFLEYCGNINDNELILVVSGVGKTNAALATSSALTKYNNIDYILNVGIVGGYKVKKHQPYVVNKTRYHDVDVTVFNYEKGQIPGSPKWFLTNEFLLNKLTDYKQASLLTGDTFSTNILTKSSYLVDMEGASIYHTAHKFNKPVISLKIVSDLVDTKEQVDEYIESEQSLDELLFIETKRILEVLL